MAAFNDLFPGLGNRYFLERYGREPVRRLYELAAWEADHIIEVIRGGDSNLENMQTLCVPCHKVKTAHMAAERAAERKYGKRVVLPPKAVQRSLLAKEST